MPLTVSDLIVLLHARSARLLADRREAAAAPPPHPIVSRVAPRAMDAASKPAIMERPRSASEVGSSQAFVDAGSRSRGASSDPGRPDRRHPKVDDETDRALSESPATKALYKSFFKQFQAVEKSYSAAQTFVDANLQVGLGHSLVASGPLLFSSAGSIF